MPLPDILSSLIAREERFLPRFLAGSAQYSLLCNRIRSLSIAKDLVSGARIPSQEELAFALPRIDSIIHKLSVSQAKHAPDSPTFRRIEPTLQTMRAVQSALNEAIQPGKDVIS